MNIAHMYQEWMKRSRIEISRYPGRRGMYRASVIAVKFETQNGSRYMLQKAKHFRNIHDGTILTEDVLGRIIQYNKAANPNAIICVYELDSLEGITRMNILGDIMRLISDPSTIRGEPQNVRV